MKTEYDYIQDPGHGWVEVEKEEIDRLEISGDISYCSYMNGTKVYLEEDCDAGVFLEAKKTRGEEVELNSINVDFTPIRDYARYTI